MPILLSQPELSRYPQLWSCESMELERTPCCA